MLHYVDIVSDYNKGYNLENINKILMSSLKYLQMDHIYKNQISLNNHQLTIGDQGISLAPYNSYSLIGIGKASFSQVTKLFTFFQKNSSMLPYHSGLIITKHGHIEQIEFPCEILESDHPQCTAQSFKSGERLINYLENLPKDTLPIICLSGGTSALIGGALAPFTPHEKEILFTQLLKSGESIERMNRIRKEVSTVKNGALLEFISSHDLITLAISDIPSRDHSLIGSGPTLYNNYSPEQLTQDIDKVFQTAKDQELLTLKQKLLTYVHSDERKKRNQKREAIQQTKNHLFHVVSDYHTYSKDLNRDLQAIAPTVVAEQPHNCSFQKGLDEHLQWIKNNITKKMIYLSGGELPVEVKGSGRGGRNSAFVATMAYHLFEKNDLQLNEQELEKVSIYSLATDGTDGPTEFAGGYIDYSLYKAGKGQDLHLEEYLHNSDSLTYLQKIGSAFQTGPTGTNIMDIRLITIGI